VHVRSILRDGKGFGGRKGYGSIKKKKKPSERDKGVVHIHRPEKKTWESTSTHEPSINHKKRFWFFLLEERGRCLACFGKTRESKLSDKSAIKKGE